MKRRINQHRFLELSTNMAVVATGESTDAFTHTTSSVATQVKITALSGCQASIIPDSNHVHLSSLQLHGDTEQLAPTKFSEDYTFAATSISVSNILLLVNT